MKKTPAKKSSVEDLQIISAHTKESMHLTYESSVVLWPLLMVISYDKLRIGSGKARLDRGYQFVQRYPLYSPTMHEAQI